MKFVRLNIIFGVENSFGRNWVQGSMYIVLSLRSL